MLPVAHVQVVHALLGVASKVMHSLIPTSLGMSTQTIACVMSCHWPLADGLCFSTWHLLVRQHIVQDPMHLAPHAQAEGLNAMVDIPPNSGAVMLSRMFGTGLWCDCVVHAVPAANEADQPSSSSCGARGAAGDMGAAGSGGMTTRLGPCKPWEVGGEGEKGESHGKGTQKRGKRAKAIVRAEVETYVEGPSSSSGVAGGAGGGGPASTAMPHTLSAAPSTPDRVPLLLGRHRSSGSRTVMDEPAPAAVAAVAVATAPSADPATTTCAITGAVIPISSRRTSSGGPAPADDPSTNSHPGHLHTRSSRNRSRPRVKAPHHASVESSAQPSTSASPNVSSRKLQPAAGQPLGCGIACHRLVLAAASDPLRAMLAGDMEEGARRVVVLHGVEPEVGRGL